MIIHTALCISIFDPYVSGVYVEFREVIIFYGQYFYFFLNDLQRPLQEYRRKPENLWVYLLEKNLQESLGKKYFFYFNIIT